MVLKVGLEYYQTGMVEYSGKAPFAKARLKESEAKTMYNNQFPLLLFTHSFRRSDHVYWVHGMQADFEPGNGLYSFVFQTPGAAAVSMHFETEWWPFFAHNCDITTKRCR